MSLPFHLNFGSDPDATKQIADIRYMMQRSSRFISLSGISGIVAGISALIGVAAAVRYFGVLKNVYHQTDKIYVSGGLLARKFMLFLFTDALLVSAITIAAAIFFTTRRAKRNGQAAWGLTTKRLLMNLFIPIISGGVFSLLMIRSGSLEMILPATLIFYGLGLVNASKYTLTDVRKLGLIEIGLGLLAGFYPEYGLPIWAIGFGVMHIIYGSLMWFKYERTEKFSKQRIE